MPTAFSDRPPSSFELEQLRLALSTYLDGSGMLMLDDGTTLPGWRDVERVVATVLGGRAPENKDIFDVIVRPKSGQGAAVGFSVKTKELDRAGALHDLGADGRVYLELANSSAKFWAALEAAGVGSDCFDRRKDPDKVGMVVLETVESWHREAADSFAKTNKGEHLDLSKSVYLVLSNAPARPKKQLPRQYQWHSFLLEFPGQLKWEYRSAKLLRAYDPERPSEALLDWYGLSGGQLKYYPRARKALYSSSPFALEALPKRIDLITEKAARYWPQRWTASGGQVTTTLASLKADAKRIEFAIASELGSHGLLEAADAPNSED
jgi:hypothetical protein